MNGKKILFFGELPSSIIHGISLANSLNIKLLSKKFNVDIVEEKSDLNEHNKASKSKIKNLLICLKSVFQLNRKKRYDYLYTVFSLSTSGSIKTLLVVFSYVLSYKNCIVLHIHRGDFKNFYYKSLLNRAITKIILFFTDKLIVLSHNQKTEFIEYFHRSNIYILENSLQDEYVFEKHEIKAKNFIYISNYIKEKGIFELLSFFEKQKNIYLVCFGGFANNELEVRKYKKENIKINSFVTGEEKFKQINEVDALILPSWNEGQPTIILEAMMLGTIVLTTKVGLIEELLGKDYPFYFEAKNEKSLASCIDDFVKYSKKDELSKKLKTEYFEKYSKVKHEKKLLEIFGN